MALINELDGLHPFFEGVQVVSRHRDSQLNHVEGIAIVDFLQRLAAVSNALHRTAVFARRTRQMHLIRLNDALQCVNGGVAVFGLEFQVTPTPKCWRMIPKAACIWSGFNGGSTC